MKPIKELVREGEGRAGNPARTAFMRRLLQIDAAADITRWLRSIGAYVEPYNRERDEWA